MIFIYTELPDNTRPHHFALEFCHDEAEAVHLAESFKSSIFFFADLCVEDHKKPEMNVISV